MPLYSTKEISQFFSVSERTMYNRLKRLANENKFVKQSMGYFYTPEEVEEIAIQLKVKISLQNSA